MNEKKYENFQNKHQVCDIKKLYPTLQILAGRETEIVT